MQIPNGPVTNILVLLNFVIWLVLSVTGSSDNIISQFGFYPAALANALAVGDGAQILLNALFYPVTGAFLHGGFTHVAMNCLLLLFTGRFVETALSSSGFLKLYVASLYAAAFLEYAINSNTAVNVIGASGAGSGVLAAYMLLYAKESAKSWGIVPAAWVRRMQLLIFWAAINLAFIFIGGPGGSNIAVWAHIGGFMAGLMLTSPLLKKRFGN